MCRATMSVNRLEAAPKVGFCLGDAQGREQAKLLVRISLGMQLFIGYLVQGSLLSVVNLLQDRDCCLLFC